MHRRARLLIFVRQLLQLFLLLLHRFALGVQLLCQFLVCRLQLRDLISQSRQVQIIRAQS